jgi:phospholipase/carboxylesterase
LQPKHVPALATDDAFKGRPVLIMHGTADPMIPVERAQEARDELLPLGLAVTLREFDMGHEISPEALRALLEWFEDLIIPGS